MRVRRLGVVRQWQVIAYLEALTVIAWMVDGPRTAGQRAFDCAFAALVGVAVFQLVAGLRGDRRRLAVAAVAVGLAVFSDQLSNQHNRALNWSAKTRDLRSKIRLRCPADRQAPALAIADRWADSPEDTTIDCTPLGDVGTYANGLRISVTVVGHENPACPTPRSFLYWARATGLALRFCDGSERPPGA